MPPDHILEKSSRVGRYIIEQVIGAGSNAVVYKAHDSGLNRTVALKVLKPEVAADKDMFARFEREARAAANLMHPHIAWVWDIGQAGDNHYLAVKYIEGVSLDKLIADQGKINWEGALRIFEEIAQALEFAHAKGIIHRDIKPKNIMISQHEGAVLTDFGLAKVLYDTAMQTRAGMVLGSPGYIPPEIWNGDPATPETDQYALACVFYEMLCGKPLFGATGNFYIVMREHLEGLPLRNSFPDDIPAAVDQPLRKALSRDIGDRYTSLGSFVTDIKAAAKIESLEPDTGDYSQPSKEEPVQAVMHPGDLNATPRDGILPGTINHLDTPRRKKTDWKARLRSIFAPSGPKYVMRSQTPAVKMYQLNQDQLFMGRDPGCEIHLDGMGISRQHAVLVRTKIGYSIKDNNSKNGTFVNGQRVIQLKQLSSGDVIDLGSSARLVFTKE